MADFEKTEVIYADRNRYDYPPYGGYYNHGCNNDRGWGALGGALVGGGVGAAAVSIWDKVNDVKSNVESVKAAVKESEAGIYKDMARSAEATNARVDGTAKEVLTNRFTTERGLCDLGYKVNSDIRDSRDAAAAGDQRILDRLCAMERAQADCCCETKSLIKDVKYELALQAERNFCELKRGQENLECLLKDQVKDARIAHLEGIVEKQRDDKLLNLMKMVYANTAPTGTTAQTGAIVGQ